MQSPRVLLSNLTVWVFNFTKIEGSQDWIQQKMRPSTGKDRDWDPEKFPAIVGTPATFTLRTSNRPTAILPPFGVVKTI